MPAPTLYVVATPIGNLEDITLRALRLLGGVDCVIAEDTRVTKKLLDRYGIVKPLIALHARSTERQVATALERVRESSACALVTDAGTPTISDPGGTFIARVRCELPEVHIEVIPGPSALTAALSIAGVDAAEFIFLGFLPHKKGRETALRDIAASERTVVCYESPHRVMKTLTALALLLDPTRRLVVCRELTKLHEEVVAGSATDLLEHFTRDPSKVRGEFVLIIEHPRAAHYIV